jgi:hypothetical protein
MTALLVLALVAAIAVTAVIDAGTMAAALIAVAGLAISVAVAALVVHIRARRTLVWESPLNGLPILWDEADEVITLGPRRHRHRPPAA